METDTATVKVADEPTLKTANYRVFKKDAIGTTEHDRWRDLGEHEFTGRYTAHPDAEDLGQRWGEGNYMFFDAARSYASVEFVTVVAVTVYEQKRDDEEA